MRVVADTNVFISGLNFSGLPRAFLRLAAEGEFRLVISEHINPKVILDVVKEDQDDNAILECAHTAHADYIVSGDKHLRDLRHYDGIPILTVAQFLKQFKYEERQEPS